MLATRSAWAGEIGDGNRAVIGQHQLQWVCAAKLSRQAQALPVFY
jgi:hypothetical protein